MKLHGTRTGKRLTLAGSVVTSITVVVKPTVRVAVHGVVKLDPGWIIGLFDEGAEVPRVMVVVSRTVIVALMVAVTVSRTVGISR